MSTVNQKVDQFQAKFETVALTLIAKLAEINESLDRISSDTELLTKIKIQLAENIKQSSAVEKHINALNSRLDKLGIGGLGIPAGGISSTPISASNSKASAPSSNGEESIFSMPVSPTIPEKEGAIKDDLSNLELPPPTPAKTSPLSPLPPMPKPKGANPLPPVSVPDPAAMLTALPPKPVPRAPTNNNPFLQIKDGGNPTFVIIQNLSQEVNGLGSGEDIGKAFLRAKDLLTAQIKFHPALFDLIKFGNDYIRKKPAVNAAFMAEVQKKVEELYHKFGGT